MKLTIKTDEPMNWQIGHQFRFGLGSIDYNAEVIEMVIDSRSDVYEYSLELTVDWGEQ